MAAMRYLGGELGLSPQVTRTLELLLSCLPPKRNHHMVFASNETLVLRSGGLTDRTLRRHVAALVKAGLLQRMDSPNKKRFTCYDPVEQTTLRFGLNLAPLFEKFLLLEEQAEILKHQAQRLAILRKQLRAASYQILANTPDHPLALEAMRVSRRNATLEEIKDQIQRLPKQAVTQTDQVSAEPLSDIGGQNVCHHHNFSKELIEKESQPSLNDLIEGCLEIQKYSLDPITTEQEAIDHAKKIGPMIGISQTLINDACLNISDWSVTLMIWMIVEAKEKIRKPAAYFKALSLKQKANGFNPFSWLKSLNPHFCPRTI